MAAPTYIPVQSSRDQHTGVLGIMHNVMARTTERDALYPARQGRARQYTFQQPTYVLHEKVRNDAGEVEIKPIQHYMVWCPACAEWQRREAFYTDATRSNGLRGYCKTCESAQAAARYHRRKLAQAS